ncbi:MAG: hypothetical protein KKC30_12175 [Proteobacteria bacterium]|nr:hypothetical protein [Pseudomonadota bacterium]MBU4384461.1 hypothetical protein [Pseudomonadota bacterium]MBU4603890.1 hypothetical protein [Pseudomonadota bacterium]MCG2766389.1 hypothetical protein [Desulfarculaceae bacterium]
MKRCGYLRAVLALLIFLSVFSSPASAQRLTPMDKKCQQESGKGSVRCLEWRALKILALSGDNKNEKLKALDILNQAHAIAPFDLHILWNIAHCNMELRDYKVALRYLDQILKMKPSYVGAKFMKCMLEERLGYSAERCKECYKSVAMYYKYRLRTSNPGYVYAKLMLGGPDAERVKKNFLAGLKPGSDDAEMWNELLRDFDREKYLHEMLP